MNCPKCGKPSVAGAAFCMHCGQRFAPATPVMAPAQGQVPMMQGAAPAFPNPNINSKKTTWIAIGTALAMILAIFFGLKASGILQFGAKNPRIEALKAEGNLTPQELLKAEGQDPNIPLLKAEGQDPTIPLLRAEGSQGPPALSHSAQRTEMPADIRRWLEHLEAIEKRKVELAAEQGDSTTDILAKVLNGIYGGAGDPDGDMPDPAAIAREEFGKLRPEWIRLTQDFTSFPAPPECQTIAVSYYQALNEIPGMTSDLERILGGVGDDRESARKDARKMQNTSETPIDDNFKKADKGVSEICSKYQTRKWFSIKSDIAGGMLGKLGAGLGLGL